jgi:hypothetical protein
MSPLRFIEAIDAMVLLTLLAWAWPRRIDDVARHAIWTSPGCCLGPFFILGLAVGMVKPAYRLRFVPLTLWLYFAALLFGATSVISDMGPPGLQALSLLLPWGLIRHACYNNTLRAGNPMALRSREGPLAARNAIVGDPTFLFGCLEPVGRELVGLNPRTAAQQGSMSGGCWVVDLLLAKE